MNTQKCPRDLHYSNCVTICYDFVKLTFIKWSIGCWVVSHGSTKDQEKLKYRSLLLTGPGGSTRYALRGHMGKSRQSAGRGRESLGLGHMSLLESMGRVL